MGFFTLSDGNIATGNEDKAHFQGFRVIPDGSKVLATITEISKKEGRKANYYEIIWTVSEGQYKGSRVRQSIFPWASDEKASDRAKEMFFRVHRCCGVLPPENEPTSYELSLLINKKCGIKVSEAQYEDNKGVWREKNELVEVHQAKDIQEFIGEKLKFDPPKFPAKNAYDDRNPPPMDIPPEFHTF